MKHWELEDWIVWPIVLILLFYVTTERILDWSPLQKIEWDAIAAIATAVAVIVALTIASAEARERRARLNDITAVFCRMATPDITAARIEFCNLRKVFGENRDKVSDAMMAEVLRQFDQKLKFRLTVATLSTLREQMLGINGQEALAFGHLLASVEQFRSNVSILVNQKMAGGWSAKIFNALRAEVLSGQLLANIAFELAWQYSEKPGNPPRDEAFKYTDEEVDFLNKYHASGEFARDPDASEN